MKKGQDVAIAVVITAVLLTGGFFGYRWYQGGAQERAYRVETERFELVARHERAQIELQDARAELKRRADEAAKNVPTLELKAPEAAEK